MKINTITFSGQLLLIAAATIFSAGICAALEAVQGRHLDTAIGADKIHSTFSLSASNQSSDVKQPQMDNKRIVLAYHSGRR